MHLKTSAHSFTRRAQIVMLEVLMAWQGIKVPVLLFAICWAALFASIAYLQLLPQGFNLTLTLVASLIGAALPTAPLTLLLLHLSRRRHDSMLERHQRESTSVDGSDVEL